MYATLQEKFPQLQACKSPEAIEKEIVKALTFYYGIIDSIELRADGIGPNREIVDRLDLILKESMTMVGGNTKAVNDALAEVGKRNAETVEQLKAIFASNQKSQVKGKSYEQIIYNELLANFKDDVVELVANTAKSADIRFTDSSSGVDILIDTKNYVTAIGKKEIDKLKRDMERNGDRYGMLVSTNGISGHKRLDIETWEDGNTILYVPNVGETRCEVIWAILLLKRLIALRASSEEVDDGKLMDNARELFAEFEEHCLMLEKLIVKYEKMWYDMETKLNDTKGDLIAQKNAMMKSLKKYSKKL